MRSGWRKGAASAAEVACGQGGAGRHRAVEHEHADVGSRVAGGQRLPVGPDAEHGVRGARVVLRHDRDAHQRHSPSTAPASARVTYGRPARNAAASATAASRG